MGRMTATMIDVDGGTVWADDSGADGPPLVLLHPGVGDSRIWDPVLPALTEKYRVIRYDARGFGQSPAPTVKHSLLRDLVAVLDHYGLDRAAIVGCSQGGASALGLALDQPQRVTALVLLCPGIPGFPFGEDDPGEDDGLFEEYGRAKAARDVDAMADRDPAHLGPGRRHPGRDGAVPLGRPRRPERRRPRGGGPGRLRPARPDLGAVVAAGRRRRLPAAGPGGQGRGRRDHRLRAGPGARHGPPAAAARPGAGAADDRRDARPRLLVTARPG